MAIDGDYVQSEGIWVVDSRGYMHASFASFCLREFVCEEVLFAHSMRVKPNRYTGFKAMMILCRHSPLLWPLAVLDRFAFCKRLYHFTAYLLHSQHSFTSSSSSSSASSSSHYPAPPTTPNSSSPFKDYGSCRGFWSLYIRVVANLFLLLLVRSRGSLSLSAYSLYSHCVGSHLTDFPRSSTDCIVFRIQSRYRRRPESSCRALGTRSLSWYFPADRASVRSALALFVRSYFLQLLSRCLVQGSIRIGACLHRDRPTPTSGTCLRRT